MNLAGRPPGIKNRSRTIFWVERNGEFLMECRSGDQAKAEATARSEANPKVTFTAKKRVIRYEDTTLITAFGGTGA